MSPTHRGKCPLCEEAGSAGSLCDSSVCRKRGVHCLPEELLKPDASHRPEVRGMIGTTIGGQFVVVEQIGSGAFGVVYLALKLPSLEKVAVKVLSSGNAKQADVQIQLQQFARETATLAELSHTNIVAYAGCGNDEGVPFLAMEYVPGGRTLSTEIKHRARTGGDLHPNEITKIVTQTAAGLACAHGHAQRIIHRDLKPDNLMLVTDEAGELQVKIVDFGLAKYIAEATRTQFAAGTIRYMAPEQLVGRGLGPATDLYALACIALELITMRQVFLGTQEQVAALKANPAFDPLSTFADYELDLPIVAFFQQALAFDSKARFQTGQQFTTAFCEMMREVSGEFELSVARDLTNLLDNTDREQIRRELAERQSELDQREEQLRQRESRLERAEAAARQSSSAIPVVPAISTTAPKTTQAPGGSTAVVPLVQANADHAVASAALPRYQPAETAPVGRQKLKYLAGFLAIIAVVASGYALIKGTAGSSRRALTLLGSTSGTKIAGDEPDDQAAGRLISDCFHPTGTFVRARFDDNAGDADALAGSVEYRGVVSEILFTMTFSFEVRRTGKKFEIKVTPKSDTSLFPPSPTCELRDWTAVGE